MKKKSCYKYIIRLLPCVLVVALFFSFASPAQAHAVSPADSQRFAAMIGAALTALNITLNSLTAPIQDAYNYLSDPFGVTYTYSDQYLDDYFDRSVIQVWDDYIEIDGVQYTDVWFGHDIANTFRVNAGDLESAWNIASNDSGTAVSGVGYFKGVPIYTVNGENVSQKYSFTIGESFSVGTRSFTSGAGSPDSEQLLVNGSTVGWYYPYDPSNRRSCLGQPSMFQWRNVNSSLTSGYKSAWLSRYNSQEIWGSSVSGTGQVLPFEFDWVSGTIPADPIPTQDTGLLIRVPSSDLNQWVEDHPEYTQPGGVTIDMDSPQVKLDVDDLLDILAPIIPIIDVDNITYAENHEAPIPPVPGPTIAETDFTVLETILNTINTSINNIVAPIVTAISGIVSPIVTAIQNGVSDILDGIGDLVDRILDDIEIGPIKVFDKVLDIIKSIFLVPLNLLRSAVGIWSYVVNWLSGISAPVYWFLAIVNSSMSLMLSPVYACVAGAIVIAIYKRFGR